MAESDSTVMRGVDLFIFSGVCPASVAVALVALCNKSLYPGISPMLGPTLALAGAGTFLVYTVDRLRDLARDRPSSPARTAFVERNRRVLTGLCVPAAAIAGIAALSEPLLAWLLLAIAFGLGLFHRRLKGHPAFGVLYVALAWVIVVVGLPVAHAPPGPLLSSEVLSVACVVGLIVAANLVGSELREAEPASLNAGRLRSARLLALAGLFASSLGAWLLVPVAVANLLALAFFRPSERYGLGVLDGAILLGALIGLAMGVGVE